MEPSPEREPGEVTRMLGAVRDGDREALDRVLALVYDELKRVAERQLRRDQPGHTLHPTALVHEAYLKLAGGRPLDVRDRQHLLSIAGRAMRQILIDYARVWRNAKRGGDRVRTSLTDAGLGFEVDLTELLALDEALERLGQADPRAREVVELRFFAGLTEEEIAGLLGVTARTVRRDWTHARAWLYRELYPET